MTPMSALRRRLRYVKLALSQPTPLHRGTDLAPIFIIGSGRSGNTLLRRILFNDPGLYIPPETYVLGRVIRHFQYSSALDWPTLVRSVLAEFACSADFETFPTPYLRQLYTSLLDTPTDQQSLAHIVDRLYLYMAHQVKPDATRWGDKTPLNVFFLDEIHATFPKARYIFLVRNGYDSALSYTKMGRYDNLTDAALRWRESNAACLKFQATQPEHVIQVSYEDLVQTPHEVIEQVCTFVGLTYSPDLLQPPADPTQLGDMGTSHYAGVSGGISTNSIGKGRAALSDTEVAQIREIIDPMASQLGYSAD